MRALGKIKNAFRKKLRDYIGNGLFGQGPVVLFFLTLHFFVAQTDKSGPKHKQRGQNGEKRQINQLPRQAGLGNGKHQGNENIADGDDMPHGGFFLQMGTGGDYTARHEIIRPFFQTACYNRPLCKPD